jgi:transcriptional regulator with XRE-family HTH domain
MPDVGRRRTPGLRREEVAVIAGVGVSWYTWLEQGRDINVSEGVLDAIAQALLLSEPERRHLYLLAGLNPPETPASPDDPLTPELRRVLESWLPRPAYVLDRHWNVEAINDAARIVLGYTEAGENCLFGFFTDPRWRTALDSWPDKATRLVAQFRADAARFPEDPWFPGLAKRLAAASPEFAELWSRHDVGQFPHGVKVITNPAVGELNFEFSSLPIADRSGSRLILYNAEPGTRTWERLNRLLDEDRLVNAG